MLRYLKYSARITILPNNKHKHFERDRLPRHSVGLWSPSLKTPAQSAEDN